jgi:hypothetical protein
MTKRSRTAGLAAFAVVASVFLLPASPAKAVTFDNACVNSLIPTQSSLIPITMTATASPNPVSPGGTVTLSNIQQHAAIPPAVFIAGYNAGVLTTGNNNIPVTNIHTQIAATNTVQGVQATNNATATAVTTITDPDGIPGTGDETATPGALDVTYADQTWTAAASGAINFREQTVVLPPPVPDPPGFTNSNAGINITAVVAGVITVRFGCDPGTVVESADPSTIVRTDPAPSFASTQIQSAPPPSNITINDVSMAEGNSGTTAFNFTVSMDAAQAAPVTVDFATADGTATQPSDYASSSGTVTFAPGVTTQPVTVQVNGDTAVEPNETFNVNLSNATGNAAITDAQGVGTIVNDDSVPVGIDAAGEVILHGPVQSKKDAKVYVFRISNLGTSPITVDPTTDIVADVEVNGTVNGSVSSLTGTKTISPGHSTRFRLSWNGTLATGDSVVFNACVNVAGDTNAGNDCDHATATAK